MKTLVCALIGLLYGFFWVVVGAGPWAALAGAILMSLGVRLALILGNV